MFRFKTHMVLYPLHYRRIFEPLFSLTFPATRDVSDSHNKTHIRSLGRYWSLDGSQYFFARRRDREHAKVVLESCVLGEWRV